MLHANEYALFETQFLNSIQTQQLPSQFSSFQTLEAYVENNLSLEQRTRLKAAFQINWEQRSKKSQAFLARESAIAGTMAASLVYIYSHSVSQSSVIGSVVGLFWAYKKSHKKAHLNAEPYGHNPIEFHDRMLSILSENKNKNIKNK